MKAPKTVRGLASAIAKREGKKSQARIGDIREIIGILSDMVYVGDGYKGSLLTMLFDNGERRYKERHGFLAKRKKK